MYVSPLSTSSVSSQESACDNQSPIPNDTSIHLSSPPQCSPVFSIKNNLQPTSVLNSSIQPQHSFGPNFHNQTQLNILQRQNTLQQLSYQSLNVQQQTTTSMQQLRFKKPKLMKKNKVSRQPVRSQNVYPHQIQSQNVSNNIFQQTTNHRQINTTQQQLIQNTNNFNGFQANSIRKPNVQPQLIPDKQVQHSIPHIVNQGHQRKQILVNPFQNMNTLNTISSRANILNLSQMSVNTRKLSGQVPFSQRGKQSLHITRSRTIAKKSLRKLQVPKSQLQRGIQNVNIQHNLRPVHHNKPTRMSQNVALNSNLNKPVNFFQQSKVISHPIQNKQRMVANHNLPGAMPGQNLQGNFAQTQQLGNLHQNNPPGSILQQNYPRKFKQQTFTQNQPALQFLNTQFIQQSRNVNVPLNTPQQDRVVLGIMKNKDGVELFVQEEIDRVRRMRNICKVSYSFHLVAKDETATSYRNKYHLLLVYPEGYTEYVSELLLVFYHKVQPNIRCKFICPSCIHRADCLCSVCRLENNRYNILPKYKLHQATEGEFKLIHKAFVGTSLKNVHIISKLEKVFKVSEDYQVNFHNPSSSRLFFHGTSVDSAMNILTTGFRILPTAASGRRFGNGCYFTPSSSTAAYYAASASRAGGTFTSVQYIFVCEIRKFKHISKPQKLRVDQLYSSINHYHGKLTFDTEADMVSPEGIPISSALKPRTVESLDTSLFADEIVVRNDEIIRPVYLAKVLTTEYENTRCKFCNK